MCANAVMKIAGAYCLACVSGVRWPFSRPLAKNVAVLNVGCPWKISGRESGHEPCRQTSIYDTLATAGMLAIARIPASTETPALSREKEHNLNSKNASNSRI